jgi:hypothetical protein
MRKLGCILLFIFTVLNAFSQNDSIKKRKWILSFVSSANKTYRIAYEGTLSDQFTKFRNDHPNYYYTKDQIPKYGWHTSVLASASMFKWLYFQIGITNDSQGFKTGIFYDTVYAKGGRILNVNSTSYKYDFRFTGLPIKFIGKLNITKKIFLSLEFGLTYYFFEGGFLNQYGTYPETRSYIGWFSQNEQFSVNSALGINFSIKKMYLSLKPNLNYFISPFYDDYINSPLDSRFNRLNLYSTGIELGLNYYLESRKKFFEKFKKKQSRKTI